MSAGRILTTVSTLVILASLGWGFWEAGPPGVQRERRLDERRVGDLQAISAAIQRHHQTHRELPTDLEQLLEAKGSRLAGSDPVTGERYVYQPRADGHFQLCANFVHDTADLPPGAGGRPAEWWHGSGRHCFERRIKQENDE